MMRCSFSGNDLPRRFADFPLELANTPVCDIDPYYHDKKTFIVISKSLSIYRLHFMFNCLPLPPTPSLCHSVSHNLSLTHTLSLTPTFSLSLSHTLSHIFLAPS